MARGTSISKLANVGAVDLQTLASHLGASLYTVLNEIKTGSGLNTGAVSATVLASSAVTAAKIAADAVGLGSGTDGAAAGKLAAKYQVVTTAAANTSVAVTHGLGRTPVGFIPVDVNKAGSFYSAGTWDSTTLWVKCETATVEATLIVF